MPGHGPRHASRSTTPGASIELRAMHDFDGASSSSTLTTIEGVVLEDHRGTLTEDWSGACRPAPRASTSGSSATVSVDGGRTIDDRWETSTDARRPGSSTSRSPIEARPMHRSPDQSKSLTASDKRGETDETVTETTTRTLEAPGATLTYDVRPGGSTDASRPVPDRLADGRGRLRHAGRATSPIARS